MRCNISITLLQQLQILLRDPNAFLTLRTARKVAQQYNILPTQHQIRPWIRGLMRRIEIATFCLRTEELHTAGRIAQQLPSQPMVLDRKSVV